jgi:hypothetical protein
MVLNAAGALLSLGTIALLFSAWRRGSGAWAAASAALLVAAIATWCAAAGVEFGLVYALTLPSLAAFAVIAAANGRRGDAPGSAPAARRLPAPTAAGTASALGRTLLVVPGAGAAAALGALAIGYLLHENAADRLVTAGLLLPLLWGLAGYWLSAARRIERPLATLAVTGIAGAAFLALGVGA